MTLIDWISDYIFSGDITGYEDLVYFTACIIAILAFGFALKALFNVFKIFIH